MSDKRTIRELQQNLVRAEAALSEMTHDRDLWASDHEEDCPNLTLLDLSRDENTELKTQVAQLQATLQEQFNAARSLAETVVKMDADKAQLQATISQLTKALKNARQLGSIGYRIGEADMRGHDKIGERYAKQQAAIESEIDTALVHAQEKP